MSTPNHPRSGDYTNGSDRSNAGNDAAAHDGLPMSADGLIAQLTGDLTPVRALTRRQGMALVAVAFVMSLIFSAALGLRADLVGGAASTLFVITTGLYFVLGLAAAATVIAIAQPRVGTHHAGWIWAAVMAALLPFAALVTTLSEPQVLSAPHAVSYGAECLRNGLLLAIASFIGLTWWLRRGAPVSPEQAGLLVGLASGALGVAALAIHCPLNSIVHIGLWHSGAVIVSAVIGRLAVPPLIRW